jgi:hypothetical protein
MLDLPRYLLGVAELAWLAGFATLGAAALRRRLLPSFEGPPAHLTTAVLALALLIWPAELLGSFGLFEPVPYIAAVALVGSGLRLGVGGGWGCPSRAAASCFSHRPVGERDGLRGEKPSKREGHPHPPPDGTGLVTMAALAIAAAAMIKFGIDVKSTLGTGITGFDSTWYHGPFAAGFFQSGSTWDLHFIAPQFLAWFYPANAEIFHAVGMLAFDRDVLSPLLNLGWFVGCLVACWCIGRPYGVAPWSLALGAVALSLPALSDQAGEARNDIVGIFFLLAAVAIALNALCGRSSFRIPETNATALLVVGFAAGLAAGTKLNFLLPAAVLVLGLVAIAAPGARWRAFLVAGLAALAAGGYWYLRNLVHSGNPLPWIDDLGPISLPAPEQALGGREGHGVLGYLTDGSVWSDWFLPGLHDGLTEFWPLLLALALAGLALCLLPRRGSFASEASDERPDRGSRLRRWADQEDAVLAVAGLTGIAAIVAWLIAPTSASGPEGMPRGFESGLRYLAPALVLGLALLPAARQLRDGLPGLSALSITPLRSHFVPHTGNKCDIDGEGRGRGRLVAFAAALVLAVALGYPVQRHYLENRYADPTFSAPGLNAAFEWSRSLEGARIATTSTRQYPLFGTDLSNQVEFVGEERPHDGFVAPTSCARWRRLLDEGDYDYVVASRDRIEPGKPPYPETARWTEGPGATVVLRTPPTVVFELNRPLDPSACPS